MGLIIKGTAKEVIEITEQLAERYKGMTIQEYLDKFEREEIILV